MLLEICIDIHSLVFALSRQINKQKYAKTINLLCAGNKVFEKHLAQWGVLTPKPPPCLRPWIDSIENLTTFWGTYSDEF